MTDVSKEYAAALFMLALEQNAKQEFHEGLLLMQKAFRNDPDYLALLSSPAISLSERIAAAKEAFSDHVPEGVMSFLLLLCEKGRLSGFFPAVEEFEKLLAESERIMDARIISAVPLTDTEKKELVNKLAQVENCAVRAEYEVDESLLGGVIVEIDGKIMDGSLRSTLRDVKDVISQ